MPRQGIRVAFFWSHFWGSEGMVNGVFCWVQPKTDIPGAEMSSGELVFVVGPGGFLVVEGAGLQTSVQDADEPVGDLAQGGVVLGTAGAFGVVEGPGAGRGAEGGEGLGHECVGEPVVADEPGHDGFLLARGAGEGAGGGVVLAGFAGGVAVRVVAELAEDPGAEDGSQAGLGPVDLSVRVPAKIRLHLPLQ